MNLADEIIIPGQLDTVFVSLIDPEVLKRCIPGCEELEKTSDTDFAAKVVLKIGPVKAKFSGTVSLDVSRAPYHLTLSGAGDGGLAGLLKVELTLNWWIRVMRRCYDIAQRQRPEEKLHNWVQD